MKKRIIFDNLSIRTKTKEILSSFSFIVQENQNVCLIGLPGVGKTTLLKAVSGDIKYDGEILKEASVKCVFSYEINTEETIYEFLGYENLKENVKNLVKDYLRLKTLQYPIKKLNSYFKLKVTILSQILKYPKFLFIDDCLNCFGKKDKFELWDLLKRLNITVLYVTSDMEDTLNFDYLVVMGHQGVLMEGKTFTVLKEEKILKRLGFSLPFLMDLSFQLKSYDLIRDVPRTKEQLVMKLWK